LDPLSGKPHLAAMVAPPEPCAPGFPGQPAAISVLGVSTTTTDRGAFATPSPTAEVLGGAPGSPRGASSSIPVSPPAERIHVVHEGDNLDRLAMRYLGDAGRALEIFDLNRDVLENPHLLPLGVELKIPRSAKAGEL
jgi:nucleoid-associated protein YgaU